MKGFGYNILSDMMKRPYAARDAACSRIIVADARHPLPAAWLHTHGAMPRPGSTYRGARRNAPRKARRMALLRKRFEAALRASPV